MKHKSIASSAELRALLGDDADWIDFVQGINLHCPAFDLGGKWQVIRRDSDIKEYFAGYEGLVYGFAIQGVNYFIFRIN